MRLQRRVFAMLLCLALLVWLLPINRLLAHQSEATTVFGRYSLSYTLLLAGYGVVGIVLLLALLSVSRILDRAPLPKRWTTLGAALVLLSVWAGFALFSSTRNTFRGPPPLELVVALVLLSLLFVASVLLLTTAPNTFRFRAHVLPALLTVLFTFIAAEIMLRIAFPTMRGPFLYDQINDSRATTWTDYTWFGRPTGAEYLIYGNGGTWSQFSINGRGISDQDYSLNKPDGVYRILLLGDSMIESKEVPLAQRFHTLVEERLRTEGRAVEIIATGISGIGTAEELLYLQHEGCAYQPDAVILGAFATNDIGNNHRVTTIWQTREFIFAPEQYALLEAKSYYELSVEGELLLRNVPTVRQEGQTTGIIGWLHGLLGRTSRVYLALHYTAQRRLRLPNEPLPLPESLQIYYDGYSGSEPPQMRNNGGVNLMTYIQPDTPVMAEAWALTAALTAQIQRMSFDCGAEVFAALLFPPRLDGEQQRANIEARLAALRAEDPFWNDYTYSDADARFERILTLLGAPTLNLRTVMRGRDEDLFLFSDGHFNVAGHQEAARVFYAWLIESGWLP